jgi:two-component system, chemotaxis family, sensor kinase CheA
VNEFLEQFLVEGRELVEQATQDLLELEQSPDDRERLDSAFRAFHTLKGAAGIVEFAPMGQALHAVEDALAAVRAGKQTISAGLITDCLTSLDQVTAWLRTIESTGELPKRAEAEAHRIVTKFADAPEFAPRTPSAGSDALTRGRELIEAQVLLVREEGAGEPSRFISALRVASNVLVTLGRRDEAARVAAGADASPTRASVNDVLQRVLQSLMGAAAITGRDEGAARTLRVDVARVDALVKLTGELTTAKNAMGHLADLASGGADAATVASMLREHHVVLDRLVTELQRSVLDVRVLPMGQVFQRFPRLVREMSNQADKPTRLVSEGEDTEADKTIVEALFEPLLHVIRNAVDHGIEPADVREANGKAAVARVTLRARRDGDHVVVEVEDDGGGIDIARVREVAIERSLAARDVIDAMDDAEAARLIFAPGFSTAREVTAVSGRGVGMDAVRSSIEAMGGTVELKNHPGQGALVRFLLPFTLMMTRVMIVHAGGQAFGVPFDAVVETMRVPHDRISPVGAARAFVYRDRTALVIDLSQTLGGAGREARPVEATLVVARVAGEFAAFEVDAVGTSLDVMLAPLDGLLAGVAGVAGATLLGDGKVLIVLDLHQLVE